MGAQCAVIALILLLTSFSFWRAKRKIWAYATLPMVLLPLANAAALLICSVFKLEEIPILLLTVIIVSVVASCVWVGIYAATFLTRKKRIPYLAVCTLFNVILGVILANHNCFGNVG